MAKSKGSSMGRLSKKLVSLALAATMMGGSGAVVGTVASMSVLPVSAANVTLKDTENTKQYAPFNVGTTVTYNGITYKALSLDKVAKVAKVAVIAIDSTASTVKGKTAISIPEKISVMCSQENVASTKSKTLTLKVTEIGDGENSICSTLGLAKLTIPNGVVSIKKNALAGVLKEGATLHLGSTDVYDLYSLELTNFDTTGMPDNLTVETYSLMALNSDKKLKEDGKTDDSGGETGGYLRYFKEAWIFKCYYGSLPYNILMNVTKKGEFAPISPVSLVSGIRDSKTNKVFGFYITPGKATAISDTNISDKVGDKDTQWGLTALNSGGTLLGHSECNATDYGAKGRLYQTANLKNVCTLLFDVYNGKVSYVGDGKNLSGTAILDTTKTIKFNNVDTVVDDAIAENTKNVFCANYPYATYAKTAYGEYELKSLIENKKLQLGYKLDGEYGKGLLLLTSALYTKTSENDIDYTDAIGSVTHNFSGTNIDGKFKTELQVDGDLRSAIVETTVGEDNKVDFAISNVSKGIKYQLLYTTMKTGTAAVDLKNVYTKWLKSWTKAKAAPLDTNGCITITDDATTLNISDAFDVDSTTSYLYCLKTTDKSGTTTNRYGVVNAGQIKAYAAATDNSIGKRLKVYAPTSTLAVYNVNDYSIAQTDNKLDSGEQFTMIVNYMIGAEAGVTSEDISSGKIKAPLYLVKDGNTIEQLSDISFNKEATDKAQLVDAKQDGTVNGYHYLLGMVNINTADASKVEVYVGAPSCDGKILPPPLNMIELTNEEGTTFKVQKVLTYSVNRLGFTLAQSGKLATGARMTISKGSISATKYYLQERVDNSWVDVSSIDTTSTITNDDGTKTTVVLTSDGFKGTAYTIKPTVGTHRYRIKAATKNGNTPFYSDAKVVTITK